MRITYGPWGETLDEVVAASRAAEAAGADVVWFPELHRSATVTAAAVAGATTTVGVGTAIALAFVRSPMTTALEALDIDELSSGRFVLGLGSGVQRLNEEWHNARWGRPVAHLRETVAAIRYFVAHAHEGAPMAVEGEWEHLRIRGYQRPFAPTRTEIPIYVAAMGPAMARLAAEIGDGWISHELCSPAYLRDRILPWLSRTGSGRSGGAAGSGWLVGGGRHPGRGRAAHRAGQVGRAGVPFDVVVSACCAIDADGRQARRWAAGLVGFYASVKTYADFFTFHGLGDGQRSVVERFRNGVPADRLGDAVTDEMVDALTLAGTPDEVRARLAAYDGLADTIKLTPPTHGLSADETRRAQAQLIELIGELT